MKKPTLQLRPLMWLGPQELTWAPLPKEALKALGLKHCSKCHRMRWLSSFYSGLAYCVSCQRAYDTTPPGRQRKRRYQRSPKGQQAQQVWRDSPGGRVSAAHAQAMRAARELMSGQPTAAEAAARCAEFDGCCAFCCQALSEWNRRATALDHVRALALLDFATPEQWRTFGSIANRLPCCSQCGPKKGARELWVKFQPPAPHPRLLELFPQPAANEDAEQLSTTTTSAQRSKRVAP